LACTYYVRNDFIGCLAVSMMVHAGWSMCELAVRQSALVKDLHWQG